mgnify:CR=1 FL=1
MSNSVNLSLDVAKTGIQNPLIKVRQGDGGFETLHTTVTANGEPMDLQGWTITFMGTTAGDHKIVDGNVTLVEAPNGIFDYTPSKTWGMDIGEFKIAYFKFVKGDGSASSANFRVNVIEAVDLTQEEAQNYISVVDTTIAEINQHLTDSLANVTQSIADANNKANTVSSNVTALGNRVDDYNNKLSTVQVGGRNYILNSKRVLDTKDPSAQHNSDSWWDLNWLDTSIPVSDFSNKVLTISIQADYDNVAVANSGARVGIEILANEVKPDGSIQERYINNWRNVKQGDSFHGRFSTTVDLRGVVLASIGAPNHWGGGLYINSITDTRVSISNPKIEISNVATDWTPAPEDAPSNDAQLVHKTGTETIAGDKTFTSPIHGDVSGNADTAAKWQTARMLSLTGDVTGSISFDGSNDVSIATTGSNFVHNTGTETITGDKTFTGKVMIGGGNYQTTTSATINYFGSTISFVRIGNQVTFTSSTSSFNSDVPIGFTAGVIPVGFRPVLQQNVRLNNQASAGAFLSFDDGGGIYSYSSYPSGTQPRISSSYITTNAWPV